MAIIIQGNWMAGQSAPIRANNTWLRTNTQTTVNLGLWCNTLLDTHILPRNCYHLPLSNGRDQQNFIEHVRMLSCLYLKTLFVFGFWFQRASCAPGPPWLEPVLANFTLCVGDHEDKPVTNDDLGAGATRYRNLRYHKPLPRHIPTTPQWK